MAPIAVTSERVYARLKADLMSGSYLPGEILVERRIAADFGVSISPVRASAYRLVGERMLALNRAGGFRVPEVFETGLRDLYFWHGQLARSAANATASARGQSGLSLEGFASPDVASMSRALFGRLAARSGNSELASAMSAASDRLHAIRLRETLVLSGLEEELRAVLTLTEHGSSQDLLRALWAYHRRRLRRIPDLVAAMHRPMITDISG